MLATAERVFEKAEEIAALTRSAGGLFAVPGISLATVIGVLAGLDLIDWAHIRSSSLDNSLEVPIQLRRLADEVDDDPGKWADRLRQLIVHEHSGCIVQAAEYVTPFLVRLCSSDRPAVARASVLLLLDLMAEPFHTEVELGNGGMHERTLSEIRAGHGSYIRMLSEPDRATREAASELLALLDEA